MLNFLPRQAVATSLLAGKRGFQRILCGRTQQEIEIPNSVIEKLGAQLDSSTTYVNGKYQALNWAAFAQIKKDAHELMQAQGDSGLQGLAPVFAQVDTLHATQAVQAEASFLNKMAQNVGSIKYSLA